MSFWISKFLNKVVAEKVQGILGPKNNLPKLIGKISGEKKEKGHLGFFGKATFIS